MHLYQQQGFWYCSCSLQQRLLLKRKVVGRLLLPSAIHLCLQIVQTQSTGKLRMKLHTHCLQKISRLRLKLLQIAPTQEEWLLVQPLNDTATIQDTPITMPHTRSFLGQIHRMTRILRAYQQLDQITHQGVHHLAMQDGYETLSLNALTLLTM